MKQLKKQITKERNCPPIKRQLKVEQHIECNHRLIMLKKR